MGGGRAHRRALVGHHEAMLAIAGFGCGVILPAQGDDVGYYVGDGGAWKWPLGQQILECQLLAGVEHQRRGGPVGVLRLGLVR